MSNLKKQEIQLMGEFVECAVMKWIRMIIARQLDAEFVFIATKEDLLAENHVTERLIKNTLMAKLDEVEKGTEEMRTKGSARVQSATKAISSKSSAPNVMFASSTSSFSVTLARACIERLISTSDRSFEMPEAFSQALAVITIMRAEAKVRDITTRINRLFVHFDELPTKLNLAPDLCTIILQTLHDLGDILWYEDLGVELFKDHVILDPMLLIDFIRQVINHTHKGQIMDHADLKVLPYWIGLIDKKQMKAMKQMLQTFHLAYSADKDRQMAWNSDLIVPAYWQTKTPAAWLFLGTDLRIQSVTSREEEAVRVHWEFHFGYGLPLSLFDHVVVASVSPHFRFDAGPDWFLVEIGDVAACRIVVGRDLKSLHRVIHVEAVEAETATSAQAKKLWASFQLLVGAFTRVIGEYPGLDVSSFAWDDEDNKVGLARVIPSNPCPSPASAKWIPPFELWDWV